MLQRGSMLQRGAAATVSSTAVELSESWQNSLKDQWGDTLRGLLQLPTTPRGFFFYLLGLATICGALSIYVLLSVQIMDTQLQIDRMDNELARIERTNSELIYQMSQKTSMAQMNQRALDQGYVHNVHRLYIRQPGLAAGIAAISPSTTTSTTPGGDPQVMSQPLSAELVDEGGEENQGENQSNGFMGTGMGTGMEPAAMAKEMGQTVADATDAALEFLTTQGENASEWLAPQAERANELFSIQAERMEGFLNR